MYLIIQIDLLQKYLRIYFRHKNLFMDEVPVLTDVPCIDSTGCMGIFFKLFTTVIRMYEFMNRMLINAIFRRGFRLDDGCFVITIACFIQIKFRYVWLLFDSLLIVSCMHLGRFYSYTMVYCHFIMYRCRKKGEKVFMRGCNFHQFVASNSPKEF